jgi:tRNA nucleotidyltransferase (CCA-adding enzyme)
VHADPSVTLEQDLERRDLTINAMAMDDDGTVIDPYRGQTDLEAKRLRHVSPHFIEDPLRVLRVARFAARYHHLGFYIADDTLALMTEIVGAGELTHLSVERVWVETEKALGEQHPEVYWQVLTDCGALAVLLPELAVSQGIAALTRAAPSTQRVDARWATLLADLPGSRALKASERLKAPKHFTLLATGVSSWRAEVKAALRDAESCAALLIGLDALRRDEPFDGFCDTLLAMEQNAPEAEWSIQLLRDARTAARAIKAKDVAHDGLAGPDLGAAIRSAQIERIRATLG